MKELKQDYSYIIQEKYISHAIKITVLEITKTTYKIKWETGATTRITKDDFHYKYNVIEEFHINPLVAFKHIVSNEESGVHKLMDEVKERENIISTLPELKPVRYINTPEFKKTIEYGRYLVVCKNGKKHLEIFNGTGWAYNHNSIIAFYLPKIDL